MLYYYPNLIISLNKLQNNIIINKVIHKNICYTHIHIEIFLNVNICEKRPKTLSLLILTCEFIVNYCFMLFILPHSSHSHIFLCTNKVVNIVNKCRNP